MVQKGVKNGKICNRTGLRNTVGESDPGGHRDRRDHRAEHLSLSSRGHGESYTGRHTAARRLGAAGSAGLPGGNGRHDPERGSKEQSSAGRGRGHWSRLHICHCFARLRRRHGAVHDREVQERASRLRQTVEASRRGERSGLHRQDRPRARRGVA